MRGFETEIECLNKYTSGRKRPEGIGIEVEGWEAVVEEKGVIQRNRGMGRS